MDITLNNGIKFPMFGLGTWQSPKEEVKTAVREALNAGYRHIDTAYMYGNEDAIGEDFEEAIKAKKFKRGDIFITTKLPSIHTRPADVALSLDISLKNLRLSYVDLYLIHGPVGLKNLGPDKVFPMKDGKLLEDDDTDLEGTWKAMEEMVKQGKAKSICVSNFNSKQIERICKIAKILPVTNQVECHAYFPQKELAEFCKKRKIIITAYSPIGSPGRPNASGSDRVLLQDPVVGELTEKYKKSPAQILLRYLLQRDIMVIPKSVTPSRIKANFNVFDFSISSDDMERLSKLGTGKRLVFITGMEAHPEYPWNIPY